MPTVLIAGTNGKGSTSATLSAIVREAGLAAGLYTSPHLIAVTERLRLADADVSPERLDAALEPVFAAADTAPAVALTYFEALTAAAFVAFAEERLDLAILEVGLGGRFDATNVAPALLSVVTSISLDHTEELGPTVGAIAREKAGIFRSGRPALVEGRPAEAREVFREAARQTGAHLHELCEEVSVGIGEPALEGTPFRLRTPERAYDLSTPLPGEHQAWNTVTAVRAAELLGPGLCIDAEAIGRGVASVRWPGRLESFFLRGRRVLLDGCHNAGGAESLARFLRATGMRPAFVFGAMSDKDVEAMAEALSAVVHAVRLVPIASPRAATPEELHRRVAPWWPDATVAASLDEALEDLLARSEEESIIVAGSLYLVGHARQLLLSGRLERT